jgi:hypothetical protein
MSAIMLSVVIAEDSFPFIAILSVVMLNVVMLGAPLRIKHDNSPQACPIVFYGRN